MSAPTLDTIVNLAKRRGIAFQSSEIYGGLRSTWDYGPLGVEMKDNVKRAWWRSMVQLRDDVVGVESAILMHPRVWEASGHVESFTDPLVECLSCHHRFRSDHLEAESIITKRVAFLDRTSAAGRLFSGPLVQLGDLRCQGLAEVGGLEHRTGSRSGRASGWGSASPTRPPRPCP